jgi:hypothetical protein
MCLGVAEAPQVADPSAGSGIPAEDARIDGGLFARGRSHEAFLACWPARAMSHEHFVLTGLIAGKTAQLKARAAPLSRVRASA